MQPQEINEMPEFKSLVKRRWTIGLLLTFLTFITYYGFIAVLGYSKDTMAIKIGEVTTLGIPAAIAVIIISFILTLIYVIWANNTYDNLVLNLKDKIKSK